MPPETSVSTDTPPDADRADTGSATDVAVDLHDDGHRREVETAIRHLAGVLAARLVPGFDRPVDELHVVATPERSPKQLVRDIQSLLYARSGISIDHRVVSIVHFEAPPDGYGPGDRVVITHVDVARHGTDLEAGVRVSEGTTSHAGHSSGPASAAGRRRAIARAALEAVRPLLADAESVEIEGVTVASLLGHDVATTLVHSYGPRGPRTVAGTAIVQGDEDRAVARSVLDALNRRITPGITEGWSH